MGSNGPQGIWGQGIEAVREEIASLEEKRQKLYGELALPQKLKDLKADVSTLMEQKESIEDEIEVLIVEKSKELTNRANERIAVLLDSIQPLENTNNALVTDNDRLRREIESCKALIDSQLDELDDISKQIKKEKITFNIYKESEKEEIAKQWANITRNVQELQIRQENVDLEVKALKGNLKLLENEKTLFKKNEVEVNEKFRQDLNRMNTLKKEAYDATNKADDYFREKRKEIEKKEIVLSDKMGEFDGIYKFFYGEKTKYNEDKIKLDKDQKDLADNWKTFEESNKNLERRIKKVNRREDDIKDKEARLGNG